MSKKMNYKQFLKAAKKDPSLYRTLDKDEFRKFTKDNNKIGHPITVYAKWFLYKKNVLGKK
jgi:hypothetical protein